MTFIPCLICGVHPSHYCWVHSASETYTLLLCQEHLEEAYKIGSHEMISKYPMIVSIFYYESKIYDK